MCEKRLQQHVSDVRRYLARKHSTGQSVSLVVVCDLMQIELGFNLVEPQLQVCGVECRYFEFWEVG